jgi:preprotein translocase SecE subunit
MAEPGKFDPKKAKKPEDPRMSAVRMRAEALATSKSGVQKPPSQFIKETWRELKMTTWPDRPVLEKSTYVVLAFIAATAVFCGGIDFVLGRATAELLAR